MQDLKPCPACGAKAVQYSNYAECSNSDCGRTGPWDDPDGAKWNAIPRREESTAQRGPAIAVDGVEYEMAPAPSLGSCDGCIADDGTEEGGSLCKKLRLHAPDSPEYFCAATVWRKREQQPSPAPASKPAEEPHCTCIPGLGDNPTCHHHGTVDPNCPKCKGRGSIGYGAQWRTCNCRRPSPLPAPAAQPAQQPTAPERVWVTPGDNGGFSTCDGAMVSALVTNGRGEISSHQYLLASVYEAKVQKLQWELRNAHAAIAEWDKVSASNAKHIMDLEAALARYSFTVMDQPTE